MADASESALPSENAPPSDIVLAASPALTMTVLKGMPFAAVSWTVTVDGLLPGVTVTGPSTGPAPAFARVGGGGVGMSCWFSTLGCGGTCSTASTCVPPGVAGVGATWETVMSCPPPLQKM